jgi:hypothetical protein
MASMYVGLLLCAIVGGVGALGFTSPGRHHDVERTVPINRERFQKAVDDYPGSVASNVARGVRTAGTVALKASEYVARHAAAPFIAVVRRHRRRGGFHRVEVDHRLEVWVGGAGSMTAGRHSYEARQVAAALLVS